jgi:hypothetical protein
MEQSLQQASDWAFAFGTTAGITRITAGALRAGWCWAANFDWNLLANHSWNTLGDRVGLANLSAFRDFDGFGVALFAALGLANSLGAALRNHLANLVGASTSLALGNHFAGGVVARLLSCLTLVATANGVGAGTGLALRNHLANGVIADSRASLALVATAYCVLASSCLALRNHLANGVVAGSCLALRNHLADGVVADLCLALGNFTAHGVRDFASSALTMVASAGNFLFLAGRNPDLLADRLRWALNTLDAALARSVNALAVASVVAPGTWLSDNFLHDRTRNRLSLGFPVTATNFDRLCVGFRNHHAVGLSADLFFFNRIVNGVIDGPLLCFVHRLHDCVIDRSRACLVYRLADGVVDRLRTSFVLWDLDRVLGLTLTSFVDRLANGVIDRLGTSLVLRDLDRVISRLGVRLVNGLHDGVVDRTGFCLVLWHHHFVLNFASGCFRYHPDGLNFAVFVINFVSCAIASFLNLIVHSFTNCSHHGVGSASDASVTRFITFSDSTTTTTTFVANRTTISSSRGIRSSNHCEQRNYWK